MEEMKLEVVLSAANVKAAWRRVKRNKGAPGVDRKTISDTKEHLKQHGRIIYDKLLAGEYKPAAVREVEIPKANGGIRKLGIPTVQDRLIQQALQQVLSGIFEPTMSNHSYGFRRHRSQHDAVAAAQEYVRQGKTWVVDIDLKSFFDQVPHDKLMHMISQKVRDKRILKLIGGYLRAPIRHKDGTQDKRLKGTPQGGPLSPLLANIYLGPLDQELESRGIAFVRYADDVALFLRSQRSAERVLESIKAWLTKHLKLEVNEDKSGVGPCGGSQLLGFRIHETGETSIAPKSIKKLKDRVRELWDARQSKSSVELRKQWRSCIRGWWTYFKFADQTYNLRDISGWIRRHMRKCFWQRWHNKAGRYNALQRLGINGRGLLVAGSKKGAWPTATHVALHQALSNKTLRNYGFIIPWELSGK